MPPVKPLAVTDVEPLHRAAEIIFLGFNDQMKVVVHQHVTVQDRPKPADALA